MEVRSYKDLVVWQKAMDMTSLVYRVTATLPADERFGLVSQARRAAVSVPANIAEGHRRSSTKDYLRFVSIAAGSLAELKRWSNLRHVCIPFDPHLWRSWLAVQMR